MKKYIGIILLLSILNLNGCTKNNDVEKGINALNEKEYELALECFSNNREKDSKIDELKRIPESFLKAKEAYEEKDFIKAYEALKSMPSSYVDYEIKDEVEALIKEVDEKASVLLKIEKDLFNINNLIDKDYLEEAKKEIKRLESIKELSEEHKKQLENYKIIITVLEMDVEKEE